MNMDNWLLILGLISGVLLLVWLVLLSFRIRNIQGVLKRQNSAILTQIEESATELAQLRKELHATKVQVQSLTQGATKQSHETSSQISALANNLEQLQNNQAQQVELMGELGNKVLLLEQESEPNRLYSRAKKMVELGADIDEIVSECELSRAEAELLLAMQGRSKSA